MKPTYCKAKDCGLVRMDREKLCSKCGGTRFTSKAPKSKGLIWAVGLTNFTMRATKNIDKT